MYIIKLKETIEEQRQIIQSKRKEDGKKKVGGPTTDGLKNNSNQLGSQMELQNDDTNMFKNEGLVRNMRKDKTNVINDYSILEKERSREKEIKSTMTFKDNSK